MADRLSRVKRRPTGAAAERDRYLLQTENDNCTFQPDLVNARNSLTADKEAMAFRAEDRMIRHISRNVLPSIRAELPHKKFDRKNMGEVMGLLLANERQVAYWGLSEAEMIQITMEGHDKQIAKLDAILSVKEFIARNCPKPPPIDRDYGRHLYGQSWSNVVDHGSTSLADALGGSAHSYGTVAGGGGGLGGDGRSGCGPGLKAALA